MIIKILIFIFIGRMKVGTSTNDEDICLIDSATIHTLSYQWTHPIGVLWSNDRPLIWYRYSYDWYYYNSWLFM